MYLTIGVLFVNISIGGALTNFAAPPILMVAGTWGWDTAFVFQTFGIKAGIAVLTASIFDGKFGPRSDTTTSTGSIGTYFQTGSISGSADGFRNRLYNVQFNNSGSFGGENNFSYYANGNVVVGTTLIANNSIISTFSNNDLVLNAKGTGVVAVKNIMKLQFQTGSTPTNVASTVQLLANTPAKLLEPLAIEPA